MNTKCSARALLVVVIVTAPLGAAVWNVPADFPRIQDAIDNPLVLTGDTIQVAPGTYLENLDFRAKDLKLVSLEGPAVTVIDGGGVDHVIEIDNGQTRFSLVEGFTIQNGYAYSGGGIYISVASPIIRGNRILRNRAYERGGGIYARDFNGIIEENEIFLNRSRKGSGIRMGPGSVDPLPVPVVRNNLICGNTPLREYSEGGGIYCKDRAVIIVNNTIHGNLADKGGGVYVTDDNENRDVVIRNCIVWGNSATAYGPDLDAGSSSTNAQWFYNNLGDDNGHGLIGSDGNISGDPLFVLPGYRDNSGTPEDLSDDAWVHDYHIQAGSPCIDAGSATDAPPRDFEGDGRYDDPATEPNTGAGTPDYVDIGADEYMYNNPPDATDDLANVHEDQSADILVLANDSDPEGDPLTVDSVTSPAFGTAINGGSYVTYTPDPDYNGPDSFDYTVTDGNGGFDTATVTVTVDPVNDDPVAGDDAASTNEDTAVTIDVLANDTDVDLDTLAVDAVTQGANGAVVNTTTNVTYTPDLDWFGTDSFTYTVSDGNGGTATAAVTVTVAPVNDAPVAQDDAAATDEDTPVTIDVLANDSDVDGDTLVVAAVSQGAHGAVTNTPSALTYTPALNWHGTDSFSYTVSDGNGGTATAAVTVTVAPVNDAPVAQDDAAATNEDTAVTIDVLANDLDIDGDTVVVAAVTQGAHGAVANTAGAVTYTPDSDWFGTDTFTYTASDGTGGSDVATVTVAVASVNDDPVAQDDAATTNEDTAVTVNVLANDSDVDLDSLTVTTVTQGANGSVTNNATTVTYAPGPDWHGTDTFTYTVIDGNGGSDVAAVTVAVNGVNDDPVAQDDAATTSEDVAVTIDVLANDSDVDLDTLVVAGVTQGARGIVTNSGTSLTYAPEPNWFGTDTFTYTASDSQGGTALAAVTVVVDPVNDDPAAQDDATVTTEDVPITVNVLANDTDVDLDTLSVSAVTPGAHGTVVNNGITVTYTPAADWNGTDSFTYTASDGAGGTDTATVTIIVEAVNDPAVASNDTAATAEDTAVTIDVLANDADPDMDVLVVDTVTNGAHGAVANNTTDVVYTPEADWNGTDSFTYTVTDSQGGTDLATVTVVVNPVNDDPVARDDAATTSEDAAVTINILGNDSDVDLDGLTVEAVTDGAHGVVANNATTVTYTPAADWNGSDSFTYTVSDGNGGTAVATVTVAVDPVNDVPVAVNDAAITPEDTAVTIDVLANDSDVDLDVLAVDSVTQGAHGAVTNNTTEVVYTPEADWNGTDSFSYTVSDGKGGTASATVAVTVDSVNDDPVAGDDAAATNEDTPVTVNVLANDSDVDLDPLIVSAVTDGAHGTVVNNATTVTYAPAADWNGSDSFTYTVSDGAGGTAEATVTITVEPVNDVPVAADDAATTAEDTATTIDVLANDADVDLDTLVVGAVTQGAHGSVVNDAAVVTYTPDPDWFGTDSFTYTVSDGAGGTDVATATVTVEAVNDDPVAADDAVTTREDVPVTLHVLVNDTDIETDPLVIESVTDPVNGSAVSDGTDVVYTPDPGFSGTDSFQYMLSDGNGGSDTGTVTVTVLPVPTAVAQLACKVQGLDIVLTWANMEVDYEVIEVRRDGVLLASLPGDTETYTDATLDPDTYSYEVRAYYGALWSVNSPTCAVKVPVPEPEDLQCESVGLTVFVSWTNALAYDSIRVTVDDDLVETYPGDTTGLEVQVATYGLHEVRIQGIWDLEPSDPAVCTVQATTLPFRRSDINVDGRIDIADGIFLLSYLFQDGFEPPCREAADSNNDARVDVADAVFPLMYLFQNGEPPASPFPGCGVDPAPQTTLGCTSYPPCEEQ